MELHSQSFSLLDADMHTLFTKPTLSFFTAGVNKPCFPKVFPDLTNAKLICFQLSEIRTGRCFIKVLGTKKIEGIFYNGSYAIDQSQCYKMWKRWLCHNTNVIIKQILELMHIKNSRHIIQKATIWRWKFFMKLYILMELKSVGT